MLKAFTAPVRFLLRFPLFQLAVVVALIFWLEAAPDTALAGRIFVGLDHLVAASVDTVGNFVTIKSFTRSGLIFSFMIAYTYFACLIIFWLARHATGLAADMAARSNLFWLRNPIARERGVAAYRAWLPLERIRPAHVSQARWEETFAWPADNKPPYRPFTESIAFDVLGYAAAIVAIGVVLQIATPFPILTWIAEFARKIIG